jgi:hypothetical protein
MRRAQTRLAVLAVLALAGAVSARGDPPKADDPDPGFLEFLGSVDRLSEVNPDYLSQANPARTARPVQPGAPPPAPPPQPSQPQQASPPRPPPGASG